MKKILSIIVFSFLITFPSHASKNGSGELKIQDDMLYAMLEWYWNTKNKADR